ncbi:DUF262 domain-containing protein [Halobaculum rarum]|uniref:DUF262 domain-containing protein n=1 Tax=Halobaculum rarum TaxID=3075122 RepID=UPI0032B002F0
MPSFEVSFGTHLFEFEEDPGDEVIRGWDWVQRSVWNNIDFDRAMLNDLFTAGNLEIPEYQRGYAWEEQQWEDLWIELEPVFADSISRNDLTEIFFGSVFTADVDNRTAEIIDGQQRITTVSLILKIIQELLAELDEIDQETEDNIAAVATSQQTLMETFFLENPGSTNPKPKLTLNDHNDEFYRALMRGTTERLAYITDQESVHGNRKRNAITIRHYAKLLRIDDAEWDAIENDNRSFDDSNKRLIEAYDYFRTHIETELATSYDTDTQRARALINLKEYLLHAFVVGHFHVSQGHPSLLMDIFQILNDRGMDLNQVDIIRARIVARLREDADPDIEAQNLQRWKDIVDLFDGDYGDVSDFLVDTISVVDSTVDSRSEVSDHLLEAFVLNPREDQTLESQLETLTGAEEFLQTLERYSSYYHNIIYPYDDGLELNDEERQRTCNDILQRLQSLRTSQWRPLVLAAYTKARESDATERAESLLVRTMHAVENVTFRQVLSSINPNRLENIYAGVAHRFTRDSDALDINVEAQLYGRFTDVYSGVNGTAFAETLIETSAINTRYAKALLWKLTDEHTGVDAMWRRSLNISEVHLEHFFPQSPFLDNIGAFDRYYWFTQFFETATDDSPIAETIGGIIDEGDDELLMEICDEYYISDLGNLGLLWNQDNVTGQNHPLSRKLPLYQLSEFDEAVVNGYFSPDEFSDDSVRTLTRWAKLKTAHGNSVSEDWGADADELGLDCDTGDEFLEAIEAEIAALERTTAFADAIAEYDDYWTRRALTERKATLLDLTLESLAFDYVETDGEEISEFDDWTEEKLATAVREEMDSRARVIVAENDAYRDEE